jgi:hypothetical protein
LEHELSERETQLELCGPGDATRQNAELFKPGRIQQNVHQFVERDGIDDVMGREAGRSGRALGVRGVGCDAEFVFKARNNTDEISEIFSIEAAEAELFEQIVIDGILADWDGGHAGSSEPRWYWAPARAGGRVEREDRIGKRGGQL